MHKFILNCFKFSRSLFQFIKIIIIFTILMLLCYWVQNLTGGNWTWLCFIAPFLKALLDLSNSICSLSFDLFGAVFELKYLSALIILTIAFMAMNLLIFLSNILEGIYSSAHFVCKKTQEAVFNKQLHNEQVAEEKKIQKYSICIQTTLKKKFSHAELGINIDEQNKLMNKFISEKLNVTPMLYKGCYLYNFNDFSNIDNVIEVLFKVLHSNAPLDYCICIQAGDNLEQLSKLIGLKYYGKITMASDTAYRYKFNETHRFGVTTVGVFQNDNNTIEVHEFIEIL